MAATSARPIKVLFLAANPAGTAPLRLDQESRAIDEALQRARYRDRFDLVQAWAVGVEDLQELLLRHQPDIVHFSGHGSDRSEIVLEADPPVGASAHGVARELELRAREHERRPGHVPVRALGQMFGLLKDNVRCVLLNACYSEEQARAIAEHIDVVVGMNTAVGDEAAIRFAAAFYQGLAFGRDVQTAFELGRNRIDLGNLEEHDTPQLLAPRVDPATVVLLGPTANSKDRPSDLGTDPKRVSQRADVSARGVNVQIGGNQTGSITAATGDANDDET